MDLEQLAMIPEYIDLTAARAFVEANYQGRRAEDGKAD
jgi:hypothetical protein